MGAVTHLTALTSLDLGWNELSVDDGARICGAAAAGGLTQLQVLELEGNGFSASSVVGSDAWRQVGLQRPCDDVVFIPSFSVLLQYSVSRDRTALADGHRHPLLPVALLRRIENSDPSLTSLEIKGNSFGGASSFQITGSYRSSDSSKFIGSSRVLGLAEALSLNTCITSLNLAGNKLGAVGLRTLMGAVTHLTALTSLDLSRNELSVDDGARICGAAAAGGMTQLQVLELEGNGFSASSVVGSDAWRQLRLPQPPTEITRRNDFSLLIQYLLSEDKEATKAIRFFVVGESTVRSLR